MATQLSTMESQWIEGSDATDSILKALKLPSDDEEEEDSENTCLFNFV